MPSAEEASELQQSLVAAGIDLEERSGIGSASSEGRAL